MRTYPISFAQPSHRAQLKHESITRVYESATNVPNINAQMYALLDILHRLPGRIAKAVTEDNKHSIKIDNDIYGSSIISLFDALKNACVVRPKVNRNGEQPCNHNYVSEAEFEKLCAQYKNVTKDDVLTWGLAY